MYVASQDAHLSPLFFFEYNNKKRRPSFCLGSALKEKRPRVAGLPLLLNFSFTVRTPWPTGASHHFLSLFSIFILLLLFPLVSKNKKVQSNNFANWLRNCFLPEASCQLQSCKKNNNIKKILIQDIW